jgi:hypothetical protein
VTVTRASEQIFQQANANVNKSIFGSILYNVKAFGAKGDGITDDTASVQATINAAIDAGGSLIFFPPGAYKVTTLTNASTMNFVGDNASFVGYAGTIIEFGVSSVNNKNAITPVFNVLGYGAKGDGVTDDTAAIQNAIDQAPAGGIIWIPSGTFKVTQLIIQNRNNLIITGSGELKGSADQVTVSIYGVIHIANSSNITIEGINISGMNSGADDRGIWINDSYNVTIRNNRFSNFGQQALYLWGANNSVESTNHVLDNYIVGNNFGIQTEVNAEYWEISRNKIINNNWGIYGALGNCRIDNNKVIMNGYGIVLNGSLGSNPDHSSISGNQINHNKNIGLMVENLVSGEQIIDNQILSNVGGAWPTTGKPHSLVMINVKDVAFIGNRVDADTSTGSWIHIDGHTECRYIGNTFHGGPFKEISAGSNNYFMGNRYLSPSKLQLHASTTNTIRGMEHENGIFLGDKTSVINKIAVTSFQNGWANDPGYYPLTYWKDAEGCVHIQGSIKGGTVGTTVFTLPAEYCPSAAVDVVAIADNTGNIAGFRIYTNGNVQQLSGGNNHVSINAMFKP